MTLLQGVMLPKLLSINIVLQLPSSDCYHILQEQYQTLHHIRNFWPQAFKRGKVTP